MPRTQPNLVKSVLGHEYGKGAELRPYIDTASSLVDEVVANDKCSTLNTTRQELIERWLAAHFYQINDPGYQSKSTGGASGAFTGQTSMTLKGTRFGQQAMLLDSTGWLERRDKEVEEGGRRMVQVMAPNDACWFD